MTFEQAIEKLGEVLSVIVRAPGPYKEKAERLRDDLSEDDISNLQEVAAWFDEEE